MDTLRAVVDSRLPDIHPKQAIENTIHNVKHQLERNADRSLKHLGLVIGLIVGVSAVGLLLVYLWRNFLKLKLGWTKKPKTHLQPPMLQLPAPVTAKGKAVGLQTGKGWRTPTLDARHKSVLSALASPSASSPIISRARTLSYSRKSRSYSKLNVPGIEEDEEIPPMPEHPSVSRPAKAVVL